MRLRIAGVCIIYALSGCSTARPVEIRPRSHSAAETLNQSGRLHEAQAQLALGNVGLALEYFRKAEREQPTSVQALAGMANCYDLVGRADLSRLYFERALASAPHDVALLTAFAASLDRRGAKVEAALLREEATLQSARSPKDGAAKVSGPQAEQPLPPRSANSSAAISASSVALTDAAPITHRPVRLERLGRGEVALVTSGRTLWSTPAKIRVSERAAATAPSAIKLLNAARERGLAARTRLLLERSGWTIVSTDDSPRVLDRSIVLYAAADHGKARQIARQLRVGIAREPRPGKITVLLGRDAIAPRSGLLE